eukprot:TRINITY_DN23276_c0_g3_i1.p1 TRINITY_DN23276_c0_g3~~TRINITY_DN23276_c0_g3_i1.p1  ORF type:complete len:663 (+),score=89.82 TRINITY_DN23276_c0_g3_i1:99-2087(+)
MEDLSGAPLVFLCAALVAVALHACGLAVTLLPRLAQAWRAWQVYRDCTDEQAAAASVDKPVRHAAALQLVLDARVKESRVVYARRYLYYVNLFCGLVMIMMASNMLLAKPRWMTPIQDYVLFVLYVGGLVIIYVLDYERRQPGGQSDRIIYTLFTLHHVLLLVFIIGASSEYVLHSVLSVCPIMICSSAAMMQPRLVSLVAVGYVVVTSYKLDNAAFMISWALELTLHLYILASSVGVTYLTRIWTWMQVHQTVAAHNWRTERLAAEGLLDLLCDCVVELDNDLRIVVESAKFASMVLVRGSLVGRRIDEFLVQSSQSTLSGVLHGNSQAVAGALNMEMMDALENTLKIELFYIQFSDIQASQERYLLGIRGYGDVSRIMRETRLPGVQSSAATEQATPQHSELSATSSALRPVSEVAVQVAPSTTLTSAEDFLFGNLRKRQEHVVNRADDAPPHDEPFVGNRLNREEQIHNRAGDVDARRVHDIIMRLAGSEEQKQLASCPDVTSSGTTSAGRSAMTTTKPDVMAAMLLQLVKSWSAAEAASSMSRACCEYHASLAVAQMVLDGQRAKPCQRDFLKTGMWQCGGCGVLHEKEPRNNECVVCNLCKPSESLAAASPLALQQMERNAEATEVEVNVSAFAAAVRVQASSLHSQHPVVTRILAL